VSKLYRELIMQQVAEYADPWAKRYVPAVFAGEINAASSLSVALSNCKRGEVARAMWQAKVARPAYRAFLLTAWLHDHQSVIAAAGTRARLAHMLRYAQFPASVDLPAAVTVWRGTCGSSGTCARRGYSWTTDRDVACWFAMRFASPSATPLVLTATVPRSDVVLVNDERREREIVLTKPPKSVVDGEAGEWRLGFARVEAANARRTAG
jgi:hypothetical protein